MCALTKEQIEKKPIVELIRCCEKTGSHVIIEDGRVSEVILVISHA